MQDFSLTSNLSKINAFCKKHHVIFFAFFGSILTNNFTEKSDIDVLVKFDANSIPTIFDIIDMESELTSIMGRQVHLKTPGDLSPYFRDDVLSKARVVYCE
jgi:predicted nucleotidyltransferase